MNFLSIFVSTFLTSYFVCWIISLLNIRKKRAWMIGVVTVANLSSIFYDVYVLITFLVNGLFNNALYLTGNLLAKIVAFIAIMMFLLDGVKIFKTKRQRAFLNALNDNKPGMPFYIVVIIFTILGSVSLAYGIIASINYTSEYLWTLIGAYSIGVIFMGLSLYLFITNKITRRDDKPIITKATKGGLLFILDYRHNRTVYESDSNDLSQLGALNDTFIFTEYGYLVTTKNKYTVLGISVDRIDEKLIQDIKMDECINLDLIETLKSFKKYETKTIWLDENYNIVKETTK